MKICRCHDVGAQRLNTIKEFFFQSGQLINSIIYLIDVWMPHFSDESNARWRVGIIRRKFHVGLKKKKEKQREIKICRICQRHGW